MKKRLDWADEKAEEVLDFLARSGDKASHEDHIDIVAQALREAYKKGWHESCSILDRTD